MPTQALPPLAALTPLLLCGAALTACSQKEASAPAPATARAPAPAATPAPAPAPAPASPTAMPATGAIDTTDLPQACAQYVQRYLACTLKLPAEQAARLNTALASAVAQMRSTATSPELPRYCFELNEDMRHTPGMQDC